MSQVSNLRRSSSIELPELPKLDGPGKTGRTGSIGGQTVEVGGGQKVPTRGEKALQAIGNFFSKLGDAITSLPGKIATAYNTYQANRAETARVKEFNTARSEMLAQLPPGVQISDDGTVSGQHTSTHYGKNTTVLGNRSEQSLDDSWREGCEAQMLKPKVMSGTIPICSQANNDLYRMDITVSGGGHTYRTTDEAERAEDKRTENIVGQLRNFAGSDQATTVLTSALNQMYSRPLLECWRLENGDMCVAKNEQGKVGSVMFRGPDGVSARADDAGGIGESKVALTRDGPNFKVSVSWDQYISGIGKPRVGDGPKPFPGMDGACIKASMRMEYVVNAQDAANGQLNVQMTGPITVDFSGKMAT